MTNNESRKELLTAEDVAQLLNITKRTLLRWARDGKIERVRISTKVILFRVEAIEEFVKSRTGGIESGTRTHDRASRQAGGPKSKTKGGGKGNSGELWNDLRKEVRAWQ
jgi:excisionase family DNA binding protein